MASNLQMGETDQALLSYIDELLAHRKRPSVRDENLHLEVLDALLATVPISDSSFRSRLQDEVEGKLRFTKGGKGPFIRLVPLRVGILLLVIAVLAVTPPGRSFAQQILGFFTPAETDTVAERTAIPPKDAVVYSSIAEAELAVGFAAKTPEDLPPGYVLDEIRVDASRQELTIFYRGPANATPVMTPMLALTQRRIPFDDLVGPDTAIEAVEVAGEKAEYVRGGWRYVETEGPRQVKQYRWEETFVPAQSLRWMMDGYYFSMSFLGSDTQPGFMARDALIELAESLR